MVELGQKENTGQIMRIILIRPAPNRAMACVELHQVQYRSVVE